MSTTLELPCTSCGRKLRVAAEHQGKKTRCPACQAIVDIPADPQDAQGSETAPILAGEPPWYLNTPEGQVFGPVDRVGLDRWVSEGRVTADCELREGASGPWRAANEVYSILEPRPQLPRGGGTPFADRSATPQSSSPLPSSNVAGMAAPNQTQPSGATVGHTNSVFQKQHRGGLILVLGLVGFFMTCPIMSIMAWVMGAADLQEMREGRMDPEGLGTTKAGMILGMIFSILSVVSFVIFMFLMLFLASRGS